MYAPVFFLAKYLTNADLDADCKDCRFLASFMALYGIELGLGHHTAGIIMKPGTSGAGKPTKIILAFRRVISPSLEG